MNFVYGVVPYYFLVFFKNQVVGRQLFQEGPSNKRGHCSLSENKFVYRSTTHLLSDSTFHLSVILTSCYPPDFTSGESELGEGKAIS